MRPRGAEPAGLYVHVPFCERACPYCDFDFQVGRRPKLDAAIADYFAGLAAELEARRELLATVASFDTLYLGGGTPSALGADGLARLIDQLDAALPLAASADQERCVELNPEHVDDQLLASLTARGIDRVSLGIQTLSATGLRQLGRAHDEAMARRSVARAVAAGLRTSADLIVGWPGQRVDELHRDLDELLAAGVEHLSVYALTIEAGTPWPKLVRRGLRVLPDDDAQSELLRAAERELAARGWDHYEVASYARPGCEAIHNGKYWRGADVIGLGPSAVSVRHGPGRVERRRNARGLAGWRAQPLGERERLDGEAAAAEGLWLALRRLRGFDVAAYLARFAVDRSWLERRVARQLALGNLELFDGGARLRVAPGRWLWHDSIAVDLL